MSERLQAIVAERQRAVRETQILIDLARRLSDPDARLAQPLDEIGVRMGPRVPPDAGGRHSREH